ncbi:MAG: YitT family protein [Bacteroidales bacterium]|nr:YitT family protein [Bacteroidales bacterium]MDD3152051.1 YitT family protein [Bacteroidales bacterium]MDD3914747.1 YitT family protein [Bacteroidales bacterium]MDD4633605.1 YitT family protein [Bacteroidales bacterium]
MAQAFSKAISTKKFWVEWFIMTFGMLIAAIAVHFFLVPSNLIIGSISGLSIVIFRLTGIPVSVISLIINVILLVLAYFLIGKEFGLKTVYTALILSPWLYLLEKIAPVTQSVMGDPWFDLLCFVLLLSATQAVLFKINASTGGLDILAKIVNKYTHVDIGTSVTVAGAVICCTAFFINDFRLVIIGLIGTWINGLVINHFTAGLNMKKRVCIISPEYQRLRDYIINDLVRGVTLYEVTGGYSNEKKVEIEALLTKDEFAKLMDLINTEQINAFITAGSVSEVYGFWIQDKKQYKQQRRKL